MAPPSRAERALRATGWVLVSIDFVWLLYSLTLVIWSESTSAAPSTNYYGQIANAFLHFGTIVSMLYFLEIQQLWRMRQKWFNIILLLVPLVTDVRNLLYVRNRVSHAEPGYTALWGLVVLALVITALCLLWYVLVVSLLEYSERTAAAAAATGDAEQPLLQATKKVNHFLKAV